MQKILQHIQNQKVAIKNHKFFLDIDKITKDTVEEKLKIWAPIFVHLTMTFRDVNQLFYYYPNPINDLQRAINAHAKIDSEHWHMLKKDLELIGINENIKSYANAMDIIWSELGKPIRNYMYHVVIRANICGDNEYLRMAAMESGETTVKMFFNTTRHIAQLFEAETGKKLYYFGDSHINSEIDNAVDIDMFKNKVLPEEILNKGLYIVNQHFMKFKQFLDYKYSITYS